VYSLEQKANEIHILLQGVHQQNGLSSSECSCHFSFSIQIWVCRCDCVVFVEGNESKNEMYFLSFMRAEILSVIMLRMNIE
jgi:hypothetical protein